MYVLVVTLLIAATTTVRGFGFCAFERCIPVSEKVSPNAKCECRVEYLSHCKAPRFCEISGVCTPSEGPLFETRCTTKYVGNRNIKECTKVTTGKTCGCSGTPDVKCVHPSPAPSPVVRDPYAEESIVWSGKGIEHSEEVEDGVNISPGEYFNHLQKRPVEISLGKKISAIIGTDGTVKERRCLNC